ncbi:MAG: AAA family ATPase [Parcubacteria group bacterium]
MNEKIILGFVGRIASGKGTVCNYLIEKRGASCHRFSTIIRNVCDNLGLDQTRENLQNLSTVLRANFGQDIFAKAIAKTADNDQRHIVCIDGVRLMQDLEHFKKLNNFHLIEVIAVERLRFDRLQSRRQNKDDADKTFEQFQKDQAQESDVEIPLVAAYAEKFIYNNGPLDELAVKIEALLREFGVSQDKETEKT